MIVRSALACIPLLAVSAAYCQQADTKNVQQVPLPAKLTKFDLDFPGGTPEQLALAIQTALGRPLNAIVPPQYSRLKLPTLKMRGIDAAQLFDAMYRASPTNEPIENTQMVGQYFTSSYGFKTNGTPSDDSVWYFFGQMAPVNAAPKRYCNFFLLTPYLDRGLSVDDITTAIQAGWKMLGDAEGAQLSYHPETKLLISVCDPDHYQVIEGALRALHDAKPIAPLQAPTSKPAADQKP